MGACGGSSSGGASGGGANAAAGEELFNEKLIGTQPGCVTCHSLEEGVVMVGPSLAGIGTTAGTRVAGQSAEDYLKASITHPDEHVVDGFDAGTMPAALADELSEQQVSDLVAYLMSLN
ncbi:MAG: hypothetical protein Kow0031_06740 [Anaerolineae bacterium]